VTSFHSFDPAEGHGLPYSPIKAIVAPRPIGWISSVSAEGIANLAPYSFFNQVSDRPPLLIFSSDGHKDSLANVVATGAFVYNLATRRQAEALSQSSARYRPDVDEFEAVGLDKIPGEAVAVPRVAGAPAAMECRLVETKTLVGLDGRPVGNTLVIGQVVRVHIDTAYLRDGLFDTVGAGTIARCGYRNAYAEIDSLFELERPIQP